MITAYAFLYIVLITAAGYTLALATNNGHLGSFVVFAGAALYVLMLATA